jgi:hypothetical protein
LIDARVVEIVGKEVFCNYPAAFGGGIISSVISITALIA